MGEVLDFYHRTLDDEILETLLTKAKQLERVDTFGCHVLSPFVLNKGWKNSLGKWIRIVGNEFD